MILSYRISLTGLLCFSLWLSGCSYKCIDECSSLPSPSLPHGVTSDEEIISEPEIESVPIDPLPEYVPLSGPIRLEGRAFADDDGVQASWGITMFWALWAAHEDPIKLETALDWLSSWDVDYVRVLSMVGSQPYWEGRVIDPQWPDYDETLETLFSVCRSRGIRVQMTIFADAQVMMPNHSDRREWLYEMAERLNPYRDVIQFVEIANESQLNGIDDDDLADLTRRWAQVSDILIAPSSPDGGGAEVALNILFSENEVNADLLTPHFDRRINTIETVYRPHRQPWEAQFYDYPLPFVNNEPIGPGSSGNTDSDPARLAIGMAVTFISGGAGHVLHSHAGVRGDQSYEDSISEGIMRAMQSVRGLLPNGIANGQRCNHHWSCHPYETNDQIWPDTHEDGVVRSYSSTLDEITYVAVMGMRDTYTVTAKWPMTISVFDVRNGNQLESVDLDTDETFIFRQHGTLRDYVHRVTRR